MSFMNYNIKTPPGKIYEIGYLESKAHNMKKLADKKNYLLHE